MGCNRLSLLFLLSIPLAARAEATPAEQAAENQRRLTAQVESLAARAHDLEEQVGALTATVDRLAKQREGDAEIRALLDAQQVELSELRRRQAKAAERRLGVGYDHGLFLVAGPLRVTLNGWAQARYLGEIERGFNTVSTFNLRSAALAARLELSSWMRGLVELDFGSTYIPAAPFAQPESALRQAYVELRPLAWLGIRGGRLRVPLGRQRLTDRMNLAEPERNLATLAFTSPQDLGVLVAASPWDGRLLVEASVTNGEAPWVDAQDRNDNRDFRYTVRVVGAPLGALPLAEGDVRARAPARFSLGGAVSYDLVPQDRPVEVSSTRANVEVLTAAGEAALSWRRLSLQAEYFYRRERYGGRLPTKGFNGASLQAQVVLLPGWLMLAAHGAYAEPHTLGATLIAPGAEGGGSFDGGILAPARALVETEIPVHAWEAGGTVIVYGASPNLKLQLAYAWRRSLMTSGDLDTHLVLAQLAAGF